MSVSYDTNTKTFKAVEEKKPKATRGNQPYCLRVKVQEPLLGTILGFAKQDKLPLTRTGKDGKQVVDRGKTTRAVSLYVIEAVKEFCQARAQVGK